jgi:hypothetical protein
MIKRSKAQIELFNTVLNLRQGRYYGKARDGAGINSLDRFLKSNVWTYVDAPDFNASLDDGTFLRNLLAVFSIRPTLVQFSKIELLLGSVPNVVKSTLMNVPVINLRLPENINNRECNVSLNGALKSVD